MPTILVVEDEILIRLHVTDVFRELGFQVLEAADGEQAMKLLKARPDIDAVFSDVTLPGKVDGLALARWLRAARPRLPVLLTSGEVNAEHLQASGDDDLPFFPKPCDYQEVAARIQGLLAARVS